jgi:uncharacterized membrane protein YsdA (DUF1294 family)
VELISHLRLIVLRISFTASNVLFRLTKRKNRMSMIEIPEWVLILAIFAMGLIGIVMGYWIGAHRAYKNVMASLRHSAEAQSKVR